VKIDSLIEVQAWSQRNHLSRRQAFQASIAASTFAILTPSWAVESTSDFDFGNRDRKSNNDALIREDYWYMMGKAPPRLLNGPIRQDDPQWNAFGSCTTQEGDSAASNSCTYVSLKQRIPIYSKYGFSIALGAKEYGMLGQALKAASKDPSNSGAWNKAYSFVAQMPQQAPPPAVDALLKMVLFASGMLTSPNYNGPNKRLLVARFYANESGFAVREIANSIRDRDANRALAAWEFGRDSWNSYFQIVNEAVSSKVGEKFELIV
jgi:hypothetical protein